MNASHGTLASKYRYAPIPEYGGFLHVTHR